MLPLPAGDGTAGIRGRGHPGGAEWKHPDRKSTRLNSSHGYISYAVFCLKKKKQQTKTNQNVKTHTSDRDMLLSYFQHKTTSFASYLTGCDYVPYDPPLIPRDL